MLDLEGAGGEALALPAHRVVLVAGSSYFASLFSNFLTFLPNKPFMGGSMEEKFGIEKNDPLRWQMVGALTYFGIMLYKDTFFGDRAGDVTRGHGRRQGGGEAEERPATEGVHHRRSRRNQVEAGQ